MSYTTVFRSSSISPTNSERKNDYVTTVNFTLYSGSLPSTGAVLKSVKMNWSSINVYSGNAPYFDFAYGRFYVSPSHSGTHSGSVTSASSGILSFTGGSLGFTVGSGSSDTANVLNVRQECVVTLTIEWEARNPSTGTLDTTQGVHGSVITLNISAADTSFTHTILWRKSDAYQTTQTVEAGVTAAMFMVPSSWPVGSASVTLTTYLNGDQVGAAQTYTWTVVVDGSVTYPTAGSLSTALVQDSRVPSAWGLFVQGYSKALLTLSGYSAGTSASIASIELTLGAQTQAGTGSTFTTDVITQTGELTPAAKIINSFGNASSTEGSPITVYPYENPKINSLIAYRCLSDGTPNDYGTYIAVTVNAAISSVNGKNQLVSLQVQYKATTATSWSTGISIESGVTKIIAAGLATDGTLYQIRAVAIDSIQNLAGTSTTKTANVLTSECVLFFKDGGLNVSVGFQGSRDNAFEVSENWHIYHGDQQIDGITSIQWGGTGASTVAGARNALGLGNTSGAVPIANGGTGATDVASARNALGLGNTSGAVPVANGGTGATAAARARSNLGITPANIGAAASSHNHDASTISTGTLPEARLPFRMCAGSFTVDGESSTSIEFSSASMKVNMSGSFSSAPFVIVAFSGASSNNSGNPGAIKAHSITTSGFQCVYGASSSTTREAMYIAIGT